MNTQQYTKPDHEPCEECGAYNHHAPLCSRNTPEQVKAHLAQYFAAYQTHAQNTAATYKRHQYKVAAAHAREMQWRGKYAAVKAENNALRRKLQNQPGKA